MNVDTIDRAVAQLMAEEEAKLASEGAVEHVPTPKMLVGYVTVDDQHWYDEEELPLPETMIVEQAVLNHPERDRLIVFELAGIEVHRVTSQPVAMYVERQA